MQPLHNAVLVRWLDDLRAGWCEVYLPLTQQLAQGSAPAITTTEVAYKRPVRFGDALIGKLWMQTGRARWTVEVGIRNGGDLVATARQTGSFPRLDNYKPSGVPAHLATQFPARG